MRTLVLVAVMTALSTEARGDATADLAALRAAVAVDLIAGRPLVVQVHVPLCDNGLIRCGGHGLGDPDSPRTNLYWATSGGFVGWFGKHGWQLVAVVPGDGQVVEVRAWRRRLRPGPAWRALGVKKPFDVIVVAHAWRGGAIDDAVSAFLADSHGDLPREVTLDDGTTVIAGGAAHVVGYAGHNRWMDVPGPDLAEAARTAGARPRGVIALACATAPYLAGNLSAPARVPLLMTADLLFAGAHAFEGAVLAFAEGRDLAGIRRRAAENYAAGQGRPLARVLGAFTNPSDRRWSRWAP
jgi:hypothetical protein